MSELDLPYFDRMLATLDTEPDAPIAQTFGHVHWGCYDEPATADDSVESYIAAAEALTRRIAATAGVGDGMRILDAGCGFGATVAYLNESLSGCELTGLNIDARQLAVARERVPPVHGNRVAFVHGDATALPFSPHAFDVVLAVECIFHFPSRRRFFAEAHRVLGPEGLLALCDFTVNDRGAIAYAASLRETAARPPDQVFFGSSNQRSVTSRAYERLAHGARFHVIVDDDITGPTLPTYPALRRLYGEAGWHDAETEVAIMEDQARAGVLEYRILAFRAAAAR